MFNNTFTSFALKKAKGPSSLANLIAISRGWHWGANHAPVSINLEYKGKKTKVSLRPRTSDFSVFYEIFFMELYSLPRGFQPKTIVDFGGNIGLASLYFHLVHPKAQIHTFEPIPENLAILKKNLIENQSTGTVVYPFGVSNSNRLIELHFDQAGEYGSANEEPSPHGISSFNVPVRNTTEALSEAGISQIDLLKIDIEGAEREVLPAIVEMLPTIEIIVGEIHGDGTQTIPLLDLLAKTHHVDFFKPMDVPLITFRASRKKWDSY